MVDERGRGSNHLREHRLRMALTQQEVAMRLEQLAWAEKRRVGITPDMVSKWERGAKRPSALYERLLCALFGTTVAELGLRPSPLGKGTNEGHERVTGESDDLLEALGVLDGSLTNAELVMPRLIERWRSDVLSRRQLMGAVGAAPILTALGLEAEQRGAGVVMRRAEVSTVAELERMVTHLEASYHALDGHSLFLPIRAVSETIQDYLAGTRQSGARTGLLRLLARANLLAGRLWLFDENRPFEARAHLDLAREAADEAADPALNAVVLGHMAFLPAVKYNFSAAESYLSAAHALLDSYESRLISSWLYAVASEVHTQAGDTRGALASIDDAARTMNGSSGREAAWFDFYDEQRLAGFIGFAMRRANRFDEARAALVGLLGGDSRLGSKQSSVVLIDLAGVHVAAGDLDEGCQLATRAVEQIGRAPYATAVQRLLDFRRTLPTQHSVAVRLLDDRISELL